MTFCQKGLVKFFEALRAIENDIYTITPCLNMPHYINIDDGDILVGINKERQCFEFIVSDLREFNVSFADEVVELDKKKMVVRIDIPTSGLVSDMILDNSSKLASLFSSLYYD